MVAMRRTFVRAKIAGATITRCNVEYDGSCGIDAAILEAAGVANFEKILVINVTNTNRFETYAIKEPVGSGTIALYGGAAKLGKPGDQLMIMTWCDLEESEIPKYPGPKVLHLKPGNKV